MLLSNIPTKNDRLRYYIARGFVDPMDRVLDLGCGTGYGSDMLSEITLDVISYDNSEENIDYAQKNHRFWPIIYQLANIERTHIPEADVAVSFETLDELLDPKLFADKLKKKIRKYIIVSVSIGMKFKTCEELESIFLDDVWHKFFGFLIDTNFVVIFYNRNYFNKNYIIKE